VRTNITHQEVCHALGLPEDLCGGIGIRRYNDGHRRYLLVDIGVEVDIGVLQLGALAALLETFNITAHWTPDHERLFPRADETVGSLTLHCSNVED